MQYHYVKQERIGREVIEEKNLVKMQTAPFRAYMKQAYPKEGMEVLFAEGANKNRLLVNLPYIPPNLNLNPYSSLARKDQHHTIYESGFGYIAGLLAHFRQKYRQGLNSMLVLRTDASWNGTECYNVVLTNDRFSYFKYKVRLEQTVDSVATLFKVNGYMILAKNGLKDYNDVSAGDVLRVPSDYGMRMSVLIDKQAFLPRVVEGYDDEGLFEKYSFLDIDPLPRFDPREFTRDCKGYDF